MQLDTMYFERDGRIGYLTLNRPTLLNAMNYQGVLGLHRVAEMIRDDPEVRLALIRGAGRAFCTGIDLKQLAAGKTPVWSKNSCGLAVIVFQEPTEPLSTLDR